MMTEDKSRLMKLKIEYELLDSHRRFNMAQINTNVNRILELFSEDIIWDKLHITDKETQMYKLQQIIKSIRTITVISNQESNEVYRSER